MKRVVLFAVLLAASWTMPEKYKAYAAPQPSRLKSNIEVILAELKLLSADS